MAMVHKITEQTWSTKSQIEEAVLDQVQWFERAADSVRASSSSSKTLNPKMIRQSRLELRRNFFSTRVLVNSWNEIPTRNDEN
jgi:hypothetical protein